jgi:hypothetical protein
LQDFAAEARKVVMETAPAKYSGKPMITPVNRSECEERFAWPSVCQDEGMFTGLHAVAVPLKSENSGPLDVVTEGGYTWICQDCYLSTDEFGTEACIRSKGFKGCFEDLNDDARAKELAGAQVPQRRNVGAVIAAAVVGGKLLEREEEGREGLQKCAAEKHNGRAFVRRYKH